MLYLGPWLTRSKSDHVSGRPRFSSAFRFRITPPSSLPFPAACLSLTLWLGIATAESDLSLLSFLLGLHPDNVHCLSVFIAQSAKTTQLFLRLKQLMPRAHQHR